MAKTLSNCSWLLVALGVFITLRYFPYTLSWLPLGLLPYGFFILAVRSARRPGTRAFVLILILSAVCAGFWFFWDALIRPSTLSLMSLDAVIVESFVAVATWLVVRRVDGVFRERA